MKIDSLLISFPWFKYTMKWDQLRKLVVYEMPKSSIYKIYQLSTSISRITVVLKNK